MCTPCKQGEYWVAAQVDLLVSGVYAATFLCDLLCPSRCNLGPWSLLLSPWQEQSGLVDVGCVQPKSPMILIWRALPCHNLPLNAVSY